MTQDLDQFLAGQREVLVTDRHARTRRIAGLVEEATRLAEEGDGASSRLDEDSPQEEGGASAREELLATAEREQLAVVDIDEALARLDRGEYETCAACRGPINRERLEALPATTLCVECKASRLGRR